MDLLRFISQTLMGFQMSLWSEWSWEVAMKEAKGQPSWKISAALHTSPDIFHNILRSVRPTFPAFLFLFFTFFHRRSLFSGWMKGERGRKRRRRRQGGVDRIMCPIELCSRRSKIEVDRCCAVVGPPDGSQERSRREIASLYCFFFFRLFFL